MRFLFVAPRFHTNQYFITKILKQKGHDVHMFVRFEVPVIEKQDIIQPVIIKHSPVFDFLTKKIFRKEKDNHFQIRWGFPFFRNYFNKLKELKPNVVIIRDPNQIFSFITLLMCRALKIKNIIIYTQGPLYRNKDLPTKINSLLLTIFRAKWITPVLGDKENYEKFDKRAYYLPFPAEPIIKSFKEKQFFEDGKINIITVGKLNLKRKNIIFLFKAVNGLKHQFPIHLTIVGFLENEQEEQYLKTLDFIQKNQLSEIVEIKKNLDFFDVHKEYLGHDLFVLPSFNEPAAYSPVEAMAAGLPVISSDTNGTQCYIKEGENGHIFKSDNLEDLTEKIRLIIRDKRNIVKMGKKSYELALKNHSPEKFYKDFIDLINTAQK